MEDGSLPSYLFLIPIVLIMIFNGLVVACKRALDYIDKSYTECIGVRDMCRELYVSKSHIHALFSEHLRISPKKYLNLKRLAYAQRLIRMGQKPYAVYRECGFSDYASFYRNYKTHFGYAPSFEAESNMQIEIVT